MPELDLLSFSKGTVTAPAGCGKTQLIADSLKLHSSGKPVLVLTHTNAGKSALETRLAKATVPGITKVKVEGKKIGACAGQMLLGRLLGNANQTNSMDLGFQIIERGSA
jgi:hypothetical protein